MWNHTRHYNISNAGKINCKWDSDIKSRITVCVCVCVSFSDPYQSYYKAHSAWTEMEFIILRGYHHKHTYKCNAHSCSYIQTQRQLMICLICVCVWHHMSLVYVYMYVCELVLGTVWRFYGSHLSPSVSKVNINRFIAWETLQSI